MNTPEEEETEELKFLRKLAEVLASSEIAGKLRNIGIQDDNRSSTEANGSSTLDSECTTKCSGNSTILNRKSSTKCTGRTILSSGILVVSNESSTECTGSSKTLSRCSSAEYNEILSDDSKSPTANNGSSNSDSESSIVSNGSSIDSESSSTDSESDRGSSSTDSESKSESSSTDSESSSTDSESDSESYSIDSKSNSERSSTDSESYSIDSESDSESSSTDSESSSTDSESSSIDSESSVASYESETVTENLQNAIESYFVIEEQPMPIESGVHIIATENDKISIVEDRITFPFYLKSCSLGALNFSDIILPLSALFMGGLYNGYCAASWLLPWFLILMGSETAAVLIYVWAMMIPENYRISDRVWSLHYFILEVLFIIECYLFYLSTDSTNDPASDNYCSSIFFYYTASFNVLMPFALIWSQFTE